MLLELLGKRKPYFARFATAPGTTILGDALVGSSFFSLWIGANDVLGYAVAGVLVKSKDNPDQLTVEMTLSPLVFLLAYAGLVDKLTENGAKE
jgi:hypothetical protein